MKAVNCIMATCLIVSAVGCSTTTGPDAEPADTESPIVWISYPPSNAVIGSEVTIVAEVMDSRAVSHVEFLVDRETVAVDSTSPYEFTWDASDQPTASTHLLSLAAWDLAGNRGESNELPVHCRWRRLIQDDNEVWLDNINFVQVRSTSTMLEFRVSINGYWENDPHDPEHGIDIGILLDVDQNQATGLREGTPGWYDPNDIGADFGASAGWEGDALWVWSQADTQWVAHGEYAYILIPDSGSEFEVGIYREDIGNPSMIDVIAVGSAAYFDWAPDTGHATYHIDGSYIGRDAAPPLASGEAALPEPGRGGVLWRRVAPR